MTPDRPHVHLPAADGYAGPALLLLHGTGGDERDLVPLRDHVAPGAPVLSPRGTVLEGSLPRFFRRLREGVFDEDDLRARTDELADFVAQARSAYAVDGPLVAVGFSNGANIASALLMQRPEVLAGVVLIAAMVPFTDPPPADLTGRPVLVSNGRRDPMATAEQTTTLLRQLRERGADVTELPHDGGHTLDPATLPVVREWLSRIA